MQEPIGTVISSINEPSTMQFSFVIKDLSKKVPIRKGEHVQLETDEGLMIARVDEILKTNRYFMHAEAVSEYGSELPNIFPVDKWEYLIAKSTSLGIFNDGKVSRTGYPPSPGTIVKKIDESILSTFFGLDKRGLNIGNMAVHRIPVSINLTNLFQKHLAILAQTGTGKSYLTTCLIEEMLEKKDGLSPAVVVIDPHGEYTGFAKDERYSDITRVFGKGNISIGFSTLSASGISELIPEMSSVQRRELMNIVETMRKKKKSYGLDDLIKEIEKGDSKSNTKDTLISWLLNLQRMKIFSRYSKPSVQELAQIGRLSIIDVSDFHRLKDKQTIVTYFARKLFNYRRFGKIPPFVFVVEEAHNFCPEGVRKEGAISKSIIQTIAREGRKFGASLVLISQRPIQLSTTALSQCNTTILLRIVNPYDIDHVGKSCEGMTQDIKNILPRLNVGEAIVTGAAVNFPLFVNVRDKKMRVESDIGVALEDAVARFVKKEKDVEAFM